MDIWEPGWGRGGWQFFSNKTQTTCSIILKTCRNGLFVYPEAHVKHRSDLEVLSWRTINLFKKKLLRTHDLPLISCLLATSKPKGNHGFWAVFEKINRIFSKIKLPNHSGFFPVPPYVQKVHFCKFLERSSKWSEFYSKKTVYPPSLSPVLKYLSSHY